MSDELVEVEESQRMSREAAAAKLRELADQLSRHNEVRFVRGGLSFSAKVPDQVDFAVEIEIGDENEIEIEIRW